MKLTALKIDNVLGVRAAKIEPTTPVTLIAGGNGAGKSSIAEAIRQALGQDPERVALKKEFEQLVHGDAEKGMIAVEFGDEAASLALPSGKSSISAALEASPALPFALDPRRFPALDEKARRSFLLSLMGVKINGRAVMAKLEARGLDANLYEQLPLAAGFEAAATEAQGYAREAKAAWRTITGEAYGDKKAEGWKAEAPEYDEAALGNLATEIAMIQSQISADRTTLGAMQERLKTAQQAGAEYAVKQKQAEGLAKARELVGLAERELNGFRPDIEALEAKAGGERKPCPPLMHELAALVEAANGWNDDSMLPRATKAIEQYDAEYRPGASDAEAAAKLPEMRKGLTVLENMLKNRQRDLLVAEEAEAWLKANPETPDSPAEVEQQVETIKAGIDEMDTKMRALERQRDEIADQKKAAESAARRTEDAGLRHAEVVGWTKIAEALLPDGIPAELLRDAIGPFNASLAAGSKLANWPTVQILDSMAISVGGRAYCFRSESEKWRADAIIAASIAKISGLNFLMLDRFDVLDAQGRSDALYWLDELAEVEGFGAIVLGTLKSIPSGLPASIGGHWINAGTVGTLEAAA